MNRYKSLCTLSLFLLSLTSYSQWASERIIYETGSEIDRLSRMLSIDMDFDGDQDVVSASRYNGKIVWYENDGLGNFQDHQVTFMAHNVVFIAAFDVNEDGLQDVLATENAKNEIYWYANNGDGSFSTKQVLLDNILRPETIAAADFNNDGKKDLIFSNEETLFWAQNFGNQTFASPQLIDSIDNYIASILPGDQLFIEDFNSDGYLDVLVSFGNQVNIYFNNSSNSFNKLNIKTSEYGDVNSIAVGDYNADGKLDLGVAYPTIDDYSKVDVYLNNDSSTFDSVVNLFVIDGQPDYLFRPTTMLMEDMDLDGDLDVIVDRSINGIVWYKNDGGDFSFSSTIFENGNSIAQLMFEDLNGDNINDLIGATSYSIAWFQKDNITSLEENIDILAKDINGKDIELIDLNKDGDDDFITTLNSQLTWLQNDGTGSFDTQTVLDSNGDNKLLNTIDLGLDNDIDLIRVTELSDIEILVNNGNNQFNEQFTIPKKLGKIDQLHVDDVNQDGQPDIIAANLGFTSSGGDLAWYNYDDFLNLENYDATIEVDDYKRDIKIADLDNDGFEDIVTTSLLGILWYRNNTDGSFVEPVQISPSSNDDPAYLAISDYDNDGDNDIAFNWRLGDDIEWLKNNGNGIFSAPIEIAASNQEKTNLTSIDYDNDGDMDLITLVSTSISNSNYNIYLYRNLGNANFDTQDTILASSSFKRNLRFGDLNGDNLPEIIFENGSSAIQILWNNGSLVSMDSLEYLSKLDLEDIDEDGDLDILALESLGNSKTTYWYENDGLGVFDTAKLLLDGQIFYGVQDFDLDGDKDLLAVGENSETVWIVNEGNLNFTEKTEIKNATVRPKPFLSDVDSDGNTDVVFIENNRIINWSKNLGDGKFILDNHIDNDFDRLFDSDIGDIDGDGLNDLVICKSGENFVSEIGYYKNIDGQGYANTSTKIIEASISLSIDNSPAVKKIELGDIDADGDIDVTFFSPYTKAISIYKNDGFGNFDLPVVYNGLETTLILKLVDVDEDGLLDILKSDGRKLRWLKNIANGDSFESKLINASSPSTYTLGVSDLNNDGDVDLFSASSLNKEIYGYENDLNEFQLANMADVNIIVNDTDEPDLPNFIQFFDKDNDGYEDILTVSNFNNENDILSLLNDGENFNPQTDNTVFSNSGWDAPFILKDLNGDGFKDFIQAKSEPGQLASIIWAANDGNNQFINFQKIESLETEIYYNLYNIIGVEDMDGDGNTDIVFNIPGEEVYIAYNDGNENFTTTQFDSNLKIHSNSIELADINNDGQMDIVGQSSSYVFFYKNLGNRTFSAPRNTTQPRRNGTKPSSFQLDIADLNNDGFPEVITTLFIKRIYNCNPYPYCDVQTFKLTVVLDYNANINKLSRVELYEDWFGHSVNSQALYEDINNDNLLDLIIKKENNILLYYATGLGTFSDPTIISNDISIVGTYSSSKPFLALNDFDNDNDLDLFLVFTSSKYQRIELIEFNDTIDFDQDGFVNGQDCDDNDATIGNQLPLPQLPQLIEACLGDEVTIEPSNITNAQYNWTGPNNFQSTEAFLYSSSIDFTSNGDYSLHYSTATCTGAIAMFQILVHDLPDVELTADGNVLTANGDGLVEFIWYQDGVALEQGNSPQFIVTESGTYSVSVVDENGCTNSSNEVDVTITSLSEHNYLSLSIYPNPVNSAFSILLPKNINGHYEILNAQASIVQEGQINGSELTLFVNDLSSGIYFIKVLSPNENYLGKFKVVK